MGPSDASRRAFLLSGSSGLTGAWLCSNWPAIAAAAEHVHVAIATSAPERFEFLQPGEVADVEAISAQIVPSGSTPGAREAHSGYFIDRALSSFFSWRAPAFRSGLASFQSSFRAAHAAAAAFAAADAAVQFEYLQTVDRTEFFETTRFLTILGMFALPQYGGNFDGSGWKLIGFDDQHVFFPPFGYYDAHYGGFIPYPTGTAS